MKQCWPGIEDLLYEALELPPDRRDSYLARACGEDADLRRELESLIGADEKAQGFLARPFLINAAHPPGAATERSSPSPVRGSILGRLMRRVGDDSPLDGCRSDEVSRLAPRSKVADRYRVIRFVERGGMGEIYHALDLKLYEPGALKFLSETMMRDERMRSRFLGERDPPTMYARDFGDRCEECRMLGYLGVAYWALGDFLKAKSYCTSAIEMAKETNDRRSEVRHRGQYIAVGEPHRGAEFMNVIARETNGRYSEGDISWALGLHHRKAGELDRAIALMQVRVDYERLVGNTEAELHAAQVDALRRRQQAKDEAQRSREPRAPSLPESRPGSHADNSATRST